MIRNLILATSIDIDKIIGTDFDSVFVPEIFWSIVIMIFLVLFSIVIFFVFKKAIKDPLKKPSTFVFVLTFLATKLEDFVVGIMGERNRKATGYFFGLFIYLFLAFTFGLTGLASPVTYIAVPLSLALWTFLWIHFTAIKENKFGYFKRFIEPIPVFLPINLVTMWAPLLSLALRMFGNALSGYCIMAVLYAGLEALSGSLFGGMAGGIYGPGPNGWQDILIAPFITPILHLYFDLFSGAIQTLVFSMLTMIFVMQEQNEQSADEILDKVQYQSM